MTEFVACEFPQHAGWLYGGRDGEEAAAQFIRITCPGCEHFTIQRWCKGCLEGVKNSGRDWRCSACSCLVSRLEKMNYVVRMGDL